MEEEKSVEELLEEEIRSSLGDVSNLPLNSKEASLAVEKLEKLYKLRAVDESEKRSKKEERRKMILQAVSIGSGFIISVSTMIWKGHWLKNGFKFEETGSMTSKGTNGLFSNITKFKD